MTNVAVITGANRGIGLEFAKLYKKNGWKVIASSRNLAQGQVSLQGIADHVLELDVSREDSIIAFSEHVSALTNHVNLLVNNAGILISDSFESAKAEDVMEQFRVNAVGPFLVTRSLLPRLETMAKVVNITSRMGSISDNTSGGYYGYRASKVALNMLTKSLAIDLPNVTIFALHPGFIKTDMTGGQGDMDAAEAVTRMMKLIESINESGGFWHRDGYSIPF